LEPSKANDVALLVMVAVPAVLVESNMNSEPLFVMTALPAVPPAPKKPREPLLTNVGAEEELLAMPLPKTFTTPVIVNVKAGAPAVNWMVLILAFAEMVTDWGAPLLVNVAVLSGTVLGGVEFQLVPVVHSLVVAPVHVPSTAWAAGTLSAPRTS